MLSYSNGIITSRYYDLDESTYSFKEKKDNTKYSK